MPDLTPDEIASRALEPAATSQDGAGSTERPIPELIDADRYSKSSAALTGTNPNGGPLSAWGKLRTARAVPPGAV